MPSATRSGVPKRLPSTGMSKPVGFSNSNAGPPLRRTRSQTSVISRMGETGVWMRFNSPRCSSPLMKSRRSEYCMAALSLKLQAASCLVSAAPPMNGVCYAASYRLRGAAKRQTTARGHNTRSPPSAGSVLAALHRHEEFIVGLGIFQTVQEEFDGSDLIHGVQDLAQNPHALQLVFAGQQFFATGAGAVDVDGR